MTIKVRQPAHDDFETSVRELAEAMAQGKARTAHLPGPSSDLVQDPAVLRTALEELRVHQEELSVADEEMRAQLDELSYTTDRARLERDRWRELFDLAPDGYFVTDRVAVVRDVNPAGAAALALEARFLRGKPLAAFVDAADVRPLRNAIDDLRLAKTVEVEVRLKPRVGEPTWHTLRAVTIESGAAVLWIARNVHARRATSDAELVTRNELRAAATDRDADLARANRDKDDLLARERQLRARLEEADAAKDRFLAVLTRDLRAPLNAVLGWTQLLRREQLDHAARDRALATIEKNANAQLSLIEELLDLSRISAQKIELDRQPVTLDDVIAGAVAAASPAARERGVELTFVHAEAPCVTSGERRRLEQIVSNLLSNALKATPPGGRVTVSLTRLGGRGRIAVEDTGCGIAPSSVPHLFDPFRHGTDDATTGEGRGLGLYVVRRAVEMHGGEVFAESDGVGQGARFTVVLPLVASPAETPVAHGDAPPPSTRLLDGVRILVVDDEEDARELMASLLRQRGAVVTTAGDVPTAVLAFDASPPDVVVSDIAMPGSDGLDLVRELRRRSSAAPTFVAVSGFASPDEVEVALDAGFDVHLAKPVDAHELIAVVHEAARARAR